MKNTFLYYRLLAGLVFLPLSILLDAEDIQGANSVEPKKVLYINSYSVGFTWSDSISKSIVSTFQGKNIELFTEYLDCKHFKQSKFQQTADFIQHKYENIKFDCVMVSDNDALDFAIRFGDSLFPDVPVVFCGINDPDNYQFEKSRFFGYIESDHPKKCLTMVSTTFPKTKQVLVVVDNTTTGVLVEDSYKKASLGFPNLKLNFVEGISIDSLLQLVKSGKGGDILVFIGIYQDKYGTRLDFSGLQEQIASLSPKPVFWNGNLSFTKGVLGGFANTGFKQGANAALLVLKFLDNPHLNNVMHINEVEELSQFDYKIMKKFGVTQNLLPKDAVILNKPMVKYWRYIKILLVILSGLLVIVVILVFNIKKRIAAEKKVQTQMLEIHDQNAQLEESYQQLGEMNCELEETNTKLLNTNESLIEAMKKVEESERLKSSFLSNMSHEIRTPLNAIIGFSSLLIDKDYSDEKHADFLNIINSNCESLLFLIDDILDLSKIEANQLPLHLVDINVLDIFSDMLQFLQLRNKKNLDIRISSFSIQNPITLHTDKIRFKQIITNLLTNSLKFTDIGFIEMGYQMNSNEEITFYVKDTGIGIEEKYQQTIFDRFIKIETNRDKIYAGNGLGLAISKRLVELMGGKIWLESKFGIGSAFYFTHSNYSVTKKSL